MLLPAHLGEPIRAAAYWTSKVATDHLKEWFDRWVDGRPPPTGKAAPSACSAGWCRRWEVPRAEDLTQRGQWRRQVLTTGEILRWAIEQAITTGAPTLPRLYAPPAPTFPPFRT